MPNEENLIPHRFSKGQSGNPLGRPKKFVTLLKERGYKQSEVTDTVLRLIACTVDELKEIFENKNATVLEKVIANGLVRDLKKGSMYNLEQLLNRSIGRPRETVEVKQEVSMEAFTVQVVKVDTPFASREEDIDLT